MSAEEIQPTAGPVIKITGKGNSIAMNQNGCIVTFQDSDVVALFDAVASVMADNKRFADRHERHRHRPRPGKRQEQEQTDATE